MRILPDPIAFQWDDGNSDKNTKKHGVSIQEAEELFASNPFLTDFDVKHSNATEKRYQGLGQTKTSRKLFVAFTVRAKKIRVISIRDMKKIEIVAYVKVETDSRI